jgi:cyclin-dependent kinase 7
MWRKPLFAGPETELSQLQRIFSILGTPSPNDWPNVNCLPNYLQFSPITPKPLSTLFPTASSDCVDLLKQLLQLNPNKRLTAEQALCHNYFTSNPAMTPIQSLPKLDSNRKLTKE